MLIVRVCICVIILVTTVVSVTITGYVVVVVASAITVVVAAPLLTGVFAVLAKNEAGGVKPSVQWSQSGPMKCGKPLASMEVIMQPFVPQSSMGVKEVVIMRLTRVLSDGLGIADNETNGKVEEAGSADTVCDSKRRIAVRRIAFSCMLVFELGKRFCRGKKKYPSVELVEVRTMEH